MKIKRYFAPDMRQAIRMVREEQGPDAVILSNRKVNGGVEIIAAIDYDEALVERAAATSQGAPGAVPSGSPSTPAPGGDGNVQAQARDRTSSPQTDSDTSASVSGTGHPGIYWSQDPALVAMQQELKQLRDMLEQQVAQLAWNDVERRHPVQASLLRRLQRLGLQSELCQSLADGTAGAADEAQAWRHALALLAHRVPVTDDDILTHGGVVALVGPTGVGKTTTVAKLAARYALRHGQRNVALVTTDSYRIGAHEQLLTYGRILGVPVQVAADAGELQAALRSLMDKQLVLIDTAGMSQRDVRLNEQFATLTGSGTAIRSYLVMSATTQQSVLDESVRAFHAGALDGCILTKMDEAASLGGALSVIVRHDLPLAYVGDGQRVPEDMHPARSHNLVSRAVALMQAERGADTQAGPVQLGGMAANAHG
ncbi:MAG TPA: flagellar biosynthesis protein FlhF [Gammaproteobacteria bacterium]|nr:flagellar biosynthesis protein FlhF [Gammaproteobacteria bacterium]